MVAPSALADTVTPPMISPDDDFTVPLSRTSAAPAVGGRMDESATPRARPAAWRARLVVRVIRDSSYLPARSARRRACGSGRRWHRQRLEVGNDRPDLAGLEAVLET